MTSLTLVGLTPPALLTSNHRLGWRKNARLTADIRSYGYIVATDAVIAGAMLPGKVRVTAYLHFKDNRRRDPANWHPTIKPLIDGFVDAGLLADDDWKHLVGPDIRIGEKHPCGLTVDIHIEGVSA